MINKKRALVMNKPSNANIGIKTKMKSYFTRRIIGLSTLMMVFFSCSFRQMKAEFSCFISHYLSTIISICSHILEQNELIKKNIIK